MDTKQVNELSNYCYHDIFQHLDGAPGIDGFFAGDIATKCESLIRRELTISRGDSKAVTQAIIILDALQKPLTLVNIIGLAWGLSDPETARLCYEGRWYHFDDNYISLCDVCKL